MTYERDTIAAYVDGELDLIAAKRFEKAMAENAELAKAVQAERSLRAKLSAHFAPAAQEPVPDRLARLLSDNVTSLNEHRPSPMSGSYRPSIMQWGAMAASLVVGLMIGGTALNRDGGYVRDTEVALVAAGDLADALQNQLASTQKADAEIRIGTSFVATDGSYCRTFESASLDGIACRQDQNWQLKQTMSGHGNGDYRQASAGALAEAAAAMMEGDALDAAAEKAATEKGWE